jgi:hypothetical protein
MSSNKSLFRKTRPDGKRVYRKRTKVIAGCTIGLIVVIVVGAIVVAVGAPEGGGSSAPVYSSATMNLAYEGGRLAHTHNVPQHSLEERFGGR